MTARLTWRARVRTAATVPLAALLLAAVPGPLAAQAWAEDTTSNTQSTPDADDTASDDTEADNTASDGGGSDDGGSRPVMVDKRKKGSGSGTNNGSNNAYNDFDKKRDNDASKKKFNSDDQEATHGYWTDKHVKEAVPIDDVLEDGESTSSNKVSSNDAPNLGQIVDDAQTSTRLDNQLDSGTSLRFSGEGPAKEAGKVASVNKVGRLLFTVEKPKKDGSGTEIVDSWCTATVVPSPHGKTIVTAAHCMTPFGKTVSKIQFIPGARLDKNGNDLAPYGRYEAGNVVVPGKFQKAAEKMKPGRTAPEGAENAAAWMEKDYAFLSVDPLHERGDKKKNRKDQVQSRVGATGISFGEKLPAENPRKVKTWGYPAADGKKTDIVESNLNSVYYKKHGTENYHYVAGSSDLAAGKGASGGPVMLDGSLDGYLLSVTKGRREHNFAAAYFDADTYDAYKGAGGFEKKYGTMDNG